MPRLALLMCLGLAVYGYGCGCIHETIEVSFIGTATGDAAQTLSGADSLAPSNTDQYSVIRDFVIYGQPVAGEGLSWPMPLGAYGLLGAWIPTTVRRGDVLPVSAVPRLGGWGLQSRGAGVAFVNLVSVDRTFVTATAQGTLTVVGAHPLRVRIDVILVGGNGATRHLTGEAAFRLIQEHTTCFS
jgi:hypothetical protein